MRNKINIPDREWSRNFWLRVKALFGNCITTETDPTVPSWAKQPTKPTYTASEVGAIPTTQKGAASGVAELDSGGKVPSSQLPAYVDDVLEYASQSAFPATGETGKIYVALDTNLTYRWSGSAYVEISPSLALGETSSTAYRGDRGKAAYDHAQAHGSAYASGLYLIQTNAEGHVIGAVAVQKSDITALGLTAADVGAVPNTADNQIVPYQWCIQKFHDGIDYRNWEFISATSSDEQRRAVIVSRQQQDGTVSMILCTWAGTNPQSPTIGVKIDSNNVADYIIGSPTKFRAAASAQLDVGFYIDAQGYLCQRISTDA